MHDMARMDGTLVSELRHGRLPEADGPYTRVRSLQVGSLIAQLANLYS